MLEIKEDLRVFLTPEQIRKSLYIKMVLGVERAADVVIGKLVRASMSGKIHARTGGLARAWTVEREPNDPLAARFVNRSPQARILEKGGIVVPKKAAALTVPLSDGPALTARGVARYDGVAGARAAGHKLFKIDVRGKAFLVESVGKGKASRLAFWYVLKDKVEIPAFHYASEAIVAARPGAVREIKRALKA